MGNDKIQINDDNSGGYQSGSLTCDKLDLPPVFPEAFTATADGQSVVLSWTEADANTTSYKIYRRDTLEGEFTEIGTSTTTSYSDTVTANGTYWYRISGNDDNGESDKTSVVKVVIGE